MVNSEAGMPADTPSSSPNRSCAISLPVLTRERPREPVPSLRLDFLRGAAALYVVIGHARGHLFAGGTHLVKAADLGWFDYGMLALLQLTSMGTEAVILFFVMSGFAMAHSFSRSQSPVSFYMKRAWRIWPPYLAATALAFVCAGIIMRSPQPNGVTAAVQTSFWGVREALHMMFYNSVDTELTAQFWSLPQEVLFYLLCPILLAGKSRVIFFFCVAIVLTVGGLVFTGIYNNPTVGGGIVYRHFFTLLIFFMTGAAAYYYQDRIPQIRGWRLLLLFAVSFTLIWFIKYVVFNGWNSISSLLTAPVALILIGNVPAKLYTNRWLNWGRFSYSLYLVHMQLIVFIGYVLARFWELEQPQMTSYWLWALVVPPVVGLSWLFYLATEKQCDAMLTRIRERERQQLAESNKPAAR